MIYFTYVLVVQYFVSTYLMIIFAIFCVSVFKV